MTTIAAIGPARIAAVRPAQPKPTDDPYEDGLDVEVVTEPTMVPLTDQVAATADSSESQLDMSQRAYAANAAATVTSIGLGDPARVPNPHVRGNSAVSTGFDSRPASNLGDAPRGDFSSPFARAMSAYSAR